MLEYNRGSGVGIYLQDPLYTDDDPKVAKEFHMQVVNGRYGQHQGLVILDETTLVVDLLVASGLFWDIVACVVSDAPPRAILSLGAMRGTSDEFYAFEKLYKAYNISDPEKEENDHTPLGCLRLYVRK